MVEYSRMSLSVTEDTMKLHRIDNAKDLPEDSLLAMLATVDFDTAKPIGYEWFGDDCTFSQPPKAPSREARLHGRILDSGYGPYWLSMGGGPAASTFSARPVPPVPPDLNDDLGDMLTENPPPPFAGKTVPTDPPLKIHTGKRKRDWQTTTKFVIIIPTILYILYDLVAYFMAGGKATLSTTTGNWLVKSFWLVLLVGLLVGHLMGSATEGQVTWRHGAVLIVSMILGYCLTVM